ncbi:MAG: hypothetical protein R2825_19025 [Saprospiraceae bacterium]
MKYPVFILLLLLLSCQGGTPNEPATEPTSEPTNETVPTPPVAEPQEPPTYSTQSPSLLHDLLRSTIRTELDFTLPETNGETVAKKSYSFEIKENNGRATWAFKVKWHDAATGKLYAGADYLLLWSVVDKNSFEIINSPDGKKTALRIKPTEGNTFIYHPYSNDPDVVVNEAILGWFDHSQDATLKRALYYMQQLAQNMDKWEFKR